MDNRSIFQTAFDQSVSNEQTQMIKAFIPYLPSKAQHFLCCYTKTAELLNTCYLFNNADHVSICSAPNSDESPLNIIKDIQQYCYGQSKQQLNQLNNLLVIFEILSVMNNS